MKTGDPGLFLLPLPTAKAMFVGESFIQIEPYKNPHTGPSQTVPIVLSRLPALTPPAIPVHPDGHLFCFPAECVIHAT